VKYPLNIKREH